jgi:hypothetical protein
MRMQVREHGSRTRLDSLVCDVLERGCHPNWHVGEPQNVGRFKLVKRIIPQQEAHSMAGVQFTEVQSRPTEFLDLTSLTLDEFEQLVQPFEDAFQAHMARWRLDGKLRTARQFAVYTNCPLPTPHDRLFEGVSDLWISY